MRKLINLEVLPDGNLKVSLTLEGRQDLPYLRDRFSCDSVWVEMVERYQTPGSAYMMLKPEEIGALTSAPIIGHGFAYDDYGEIQQGGDNPKVWWFPQYETVDEFEELLKPGGFIIMTLAPSPVEDEPTVDEEEHENRYKNDIVYHTPGPWFVNGPYHNVESDLFIRARIDDDENFDIANLECDETGNAPANARLIAAAPELLASLRELIHQVDSLGVEEGMPWMVDILARANAAVAKATQG